MTINDPATPGEVVQYRGFTLVAPEEQDAVRTRNTHAVDAESPTQTSASPGEIGVAYYR